MNNFLANLTTTQKSLLVAIIAIIIYVTSTAISYSVFASMGSGSTQLAGGVPGTATTDEGEDPNEPRTESCPLNGNLHTKKAKQVWDKKRPLAVMIENHQESRPQSGLTSADVVYEAVAEGGITRFMAVYLCNPADVLVGPVRSARTYFLDWLSEYNALYSHVGGANCTGGPMAPGCQNGAPADALGQIIKYNIKDLDQRGISFPTYFRDYLRLGRTVATEHTMYSSTQKLWDAGTKRGWTEVEQNGSKWDKGFIQWKFKDPDKTSGQVSKISVPFWESQTNYIVEWNFDPTCNCYKRKNGGQDHIDLNNKKQLQPKTIIVQFQQEGRANDGYEGNVHLLYKNKGKGKALIFQDGKVITGTWNKADRLSRSKYTDDSGKEVVFNKGQIWIQTVPEGNTVTY